MMLWKQKKYRLVSAVLSAAIFLTSTTQPYFVFATQEPDMQEGTAADEVKLKFTADMDGVSGEERKFKTTITFESYDDSDTGFNSLTESILVGDTEFNLSSIDGLKMVDSRTPKRRTMEVMTETFIKGTENDFLPDALIKKDGISWKLTNKELVDKEIRDRTKDAVATKRYIGVEKDFPIPDTIEYTYTDANTGKSIHEMLPLTDQSESSWYWMPFEFPITISGYGADVLDLNGTEIPADAQLADYSSEFLKMLGLNQEYYRIDSIVWDKEPYEQNGELCRNAMGRGEKYVTDIDAVYSGTVTLPHQDGAAWKCQYTEELDDSHRAVYTYTAEAVYVSSIEQPTFDRILGVISAFYHSIIEAIKEHPVLAAVQMMAIAGLITFIVSRRKKKCLYNDFRQCTYKQDCVNCPYYTTLSKEKKDKGIF